MALLGNLTGSSQFFNNTEFYKGVATQSLRFDDGSSAYLSRTPSSAGNRRAYTLSFWVKRANIGIADCALFGVQTDASNRVYIRWEADDTFKVYFAIGGSAYDNGTSMVFRDTSAWYHIVIAVDMDGSANTDKLKIYVNGTNQTVSYNTTLPTSDTAMNSTSLHTLGKKDGASNFLDSYTSEFNFIDGTALNPTSFGETKNGVWIPIKYTGSYGTNGYRLQFNQTGTGSASTSTIGADTSGNNNHFTSSGIAASDCAMPDSPENNFSTLLGSLSESSDYQSYAKGTYSEGNLKVTGISGWTNGKNNFLVNSGKWYAEVRVNAWVASHYVRIGVFARPARTYDEYFWLGNGTAQIDASSVSSRVGTFTTGDVLQIAIDLENNNIFFGKNNTWQNSATQAEIEAGTSTNAFASGSEVPTGDGHYYGIYGNPHSTSTNITFNFGQDSSFAGTETAQGNTDDNDIGDFYYAPPSGFLALCSANLPEPTIGPNSATQADDYFNTVLWTGNGSNPRNITGVGFQPDWVWHKPRNLAYNHLTWDSSRGVGSNSLLTLYPNLTNAEVDTTQSQGNASSLNADGFTVIAGSSGDNHVNDASYNYVAWNWKANGGTTSSNTDGSITSTVQANTKAGFSIVTYTGTGSNATVGHGLGAVPAMYIVKRREAYGTPNWVVYHKGIDSSAPEDFFLRLDTTATRQNSATVWNDTAPTSSVFSIGTSNVSNYDAGFIAYCFAEIEGYSRFGTYTGNGNANGPYVFIGFKPSWILIKRRADAAENWWIYDNKRDTFNPNTQIIYADANNAEITGTGDNISNDFVSNGIKLRTANVNWNASGSEYIYMAFAEAPFKYANAR